MAQSLNDLVERAIASAMRPADPDDTSATRDCDNELQRIETLLASTAAGPEDFGLLSHVRATRIFLAARLGDAEAVIRQSEGFLASSPTSGLDTFNVQIFRMRALHAVGRHDVEIRAALDLAGSASLGAEDFVLLLEGLAQRHPGCFNSSSFLFDRMERTLEQLTIAGCANLPQADQIPINFERVALDAARALRRLNEARTEALLDESGA